MTLLPQSVEDWREFTLTRGPRMAAEAFLLKLAEMAPASPSNAAGSEDVARAAPISCGRNVEPAKVGSCCRK